MHALNEKIEEMRDQADNNLEEMHYYADNNLEEMQMRYYTWVRYIRKCPQIEDAFLREV